GCGTGFLSVHLVRLAGHRKVILTDVSPEMLRLCRERVSKETRELDRNVSFSELDAGNLKDQSMYAVIASSFTLQWLPEMTAVLQRMVDALLPGGLLMLAFPTVDSFPEWRQACEDTGATFTGNALPDPDAVVKKLRDMGMRTSLARRPVVIG